MKELGCILDFERDMLQIRTQNGMKTMPITDSATGHPVVRLSDYGANVHEEFPVRFHQKKATVVAKQETAEVNLGPHHDVDSLNEEAEYGKQHDSEAEDEHGVFSVVKRIARGARKRLARVTTQLSEAFRTEARTTMKPTRSHRRPRFLEICTWTAMLSTVALGRGWDVWQPASLETGFDLGRHSCLVLELQPYRPNFWTCLYRLRVYKDTLFLEHIGHA